MIKVTSSEIQVKWFSFIIHISLRSPNQLQCSIKVLLSFITIFSIDKSMWNLFSTYEFMICCVLWAFNSTSPRMAAENDLNKFFSLISLNGVAPRIIITTKTRNHSRLISHWMGRESFSFLPFKYALQQKPEIMNRFRIMSFNYRDLVLI